MIHKKHIHIYIYIYTQIHICRYICRDERSELRDERRREVYIEELGCFKKMVEGEAERQRGGVEKGFLYLVLAVDILNKLNCLWPC